MRVLCLWWLVVSDWCNMSLLSYDARAVRPLRGRGPLRSSAMVVGSSATADTSSWETCSVLTL